MSELSFEINPGQRWKEMSTPDSVYLFFREKAVKKLKEQLKDLRYMTATGLQTVVGAEFYSIRHKLRGHKQGWLAWQHWRAQEDDWLIRLVTRTLQENVKWLREQKASAK
jgi:hypothetical protein